MNFSFRFMLGLALAPLVACATDALAQQPPPQGAPTSLAPPPSAYPQRRFGMGTAFGAGFGAFTVASPTGSTISSGIAPALMLPTLELQGFLPNDFSFDVTTPLVNEIIASAVLGGFVFNADVFLDFNLGEGNVQCVLGPGVGFSVAAYKSATVGSFRVPAEVGFEILTNNQAFGFKVLARPWIEFAGGDTVSAIGGGAVALLGLSGYVTD
ncbi:MAG: hypothetical protein U0414_03425 [Polyangiaceae bacterium]